MTSRRGWKVDTPFLDHDGHLSLGGDGKGTPDLAHVLLQVARDDGMDVDDNDADLQGPDILLVYEVCVQRGKHSILPLSCPEEITIVEVGPSLMLGRHDLIVVGKPGAKAVGNVVAWTYPHV